jgi:glycosyltransferase involved in cell wall biosynthesis
MTIGINGYESVIPRFGFDNKTGLPKRVGSGEYCFELLSHLYKIDIKNNYVIYLPEPPTSDLPKEKSNWHYKVVKPGSMWTIFGLSLELMLYRSNIDVFFSPTHYLPFFAPKKSAISVLDLSFLHFPNLFKKKDLYQLRYWTKFSSKKADKIFTISKSSKDDIIKEYDLPKNKVIVTYPGIKAESRIMNNESRIKDIRKKYEIDGEYVLFVGTLQPRKNIARLIKAFSSLCHPEASAEGSKILLRQPADQNDIELIIVGKKGWQYQDILQTPKKFGIENKVKFLDQVDDEELKVLYKNAICFVLPSLYEGFGLPVLEAMQYGCPVITSNISSLPEAGGDACLYVNPEDVNDIKDKLDKIIKDKKLREGLVKKGYDQAKKFSWEETAKETLKELEGLSINDK